MQAPKSIYRTLLFCAVAGLTANILVASTTTILDADFESQALGPIGTGGAANGEPLNVNAFIDADVVDTGSPMPTQSLRLTDQSSVSAQTVTFGFVNGEEVKRGLVTIRMDLWFEGPLANTDRFTVQIRESGTSGRAFANLSLNSTNVGITDAGPTGFTTLGSVVPDRVFPVEFVFDMERLTYNVTVDGSQVVTNRYHSVADRGIGSVNVGVEFDANTGDRFYVDNIVVTKQAPVAGTELLSASFEDKTVDATIGSGGAAVGEPSGLSPEIGAIVRDLGIATRQLEIIDESTGSHQQAAFSLLGNADIAEGTIRARLNLWFDQADTYRFLFLDATSSVSFAEALFGISFIHTNGTGDRELLIADHSTANGGIAFTDTTDDGYIIDRGRAIRLELLIDLDAGHYSVTWDGQKLVDNRDYAQPTRSFARIVLEIAADPDTGDSFHIDDIMVEDISPDPIFDDGFESGDINAWQ